jgi:hypothetical protein
MQTFGASAPLKELQRKFGFEPDQVVAVAKELLRRNDFETSRVDLCGQDVRGSRRKPVRNDSGVLSQIAIYETQNRS